MYRNNMKDISLEWLRSAKSDIETIDAILEKNNWLLNIFHTSCVPKVARK
ncbi:MAG: hypothetical protein JRD71_03675 [Deltaproteobacteria bacterium]|nr:hypothetical protein [Deltaproteobacteria bacterium]